MYKGSLSRLLNEWNEQLSRKLQENLPQWLEIALRDQIQINNEILTNQDERKQSIYRN